MTLPTFIIRGALATTLGLLVLPSIAQGQGNLRLQFMTFPMTPEPLAVELLVGEGQTIKLQIPSNEFSETVSVPAMGSLVFGETVVNEVTKKPGFKIYGQGKPLTAPKQLVFLLRKGAAIADGFEVRAISSDLNDFSGGKFLFVNATNVNVGGTTGGKPFALKPGAHTIIKPTLEANGRLTHVELFYSREGKAVPFFSTMWPVSEHYRGLIFFYNDPKNAGKIQLHSFRDFLEGNG